MLGSTSRPRRGRRTPIDVGSASANQIPRLKLVDLSGRWLRSETADRGRDRRVFNHLMVVGTSFNTAFALMDDVASTSFGEYPPCIRVFGFSVAPT